MNLTQFMNVISQLVFKSCNIIQSIYETSSLKIQMKSQFNPVTDADMSIQLMLVKHLTHFWPELQIVAQQNIPHEKYTYNVSQNPLKDYTEVFQNYFQNSVIDLEDVCVWIDPLDGTFSFTEGRLEDVTVMVGVSFKQKARIGIIGIPYQKVSTHSSCVFNPRVVLSDSVNRTAIQINKNFSKIQILSFSKNLTDQIVISQNLSHQETEILKNITSSTLKTYAMGNKFMRLIRENAAGIVYLGGFASLWDTCAGEALIRSIGGLVTNLYGNDIFYDNTRKNYNLGDGIICAFQNSMFEKIRTNLIKLLQI